MSDPTRPSRHSLALGRAREAGQAALALVLLIVLLLVTGGTILATNAQQHDPLLQQDALEHYAYRALEAGIDTLLNTINAQPNLVNCSTVKTTKTCTNKTNGIAYDQWTQVQHTTPTGASGVVPEWYLWTNPQFCFSSTRVIDTACTSSSASGNLEAVSIEVIGAAGVAPHYDYQSSVASFAPKNGFLTHVWWSNYEISDPSLRTKTPSTCAWDWKTNKYTNTTGSGCTPVYFAVNDHVVGPVFSNDSIYVTGSGSKKPVFDTPAGTHPSPVTTADPGCLFISKSSPKSRTSPLPTPNCATAKTQVGAYTITNSHHGSAYFEQPPTTNTSLATIAKEDGCLYQGPTIISFYVTSASKKGMMHVWSPETPRSGGHDNLNTVNNTNVCLTTSTTQTPTTTAIQVPEGVNSTATALAGNGVIYVESSTSGVGGSGSCIGNGVSPFDGVAQGHTTKAQILPATTGTVHGYNFTDDQLTHTYKKADCEGDVFVRDAKSATGKTPGITGSITVAAQSNVIVTGSLLYTDCKTSSGSWTSTKTCLYNTGATSVNDSLGLIATHFVEVNHPGVASCRTVTTPTRHGSKTKQCNTSPSSLQSNCASTVKTLTAVLCNPATTLTIDAAILALNNSFAVNNYAIRSSNSPSTGSGTTGHLYVYGTIAQDWRGPVGTFSGTTMVSGYSKWYTFDSRLQYVSIPYYLTPSTPAWELESSSVLLANSCPTWPKPYPTTGSITKATTKGPTGASGVC